MFINKLFGLNFILHPSGILKVNLDNNKVIYFKTNQTSYVTVKLFWEGYKNFEYSTIFFDLVKNINSFIDEILALAGALEQNPLHCGMTHDC